MTLREYRHGCGLTLHQFALLLGVHFTTLQKWETSVRMPDAVGVAAIERLTKGQVKASSFRRLGSPAVVPKQGVPVRASARPARSRRPRGGTTGCRDEERGSPVRDGGVVGGALV